MQAKASSKKHTHTYSHQHRHPHTGITWSSCCRAVTPVLLSPVAPSVLTVQDATCHRGHTRDGSQVAAEGEGRRQGTQVRVARGGQRHPKRVQIGPEEQRKGEGSVLGEEGGSLSYTRMRVVHKVEER